MTRMVQALRFLAEFCWGQISGAFAALQMVSWPLSKAARRSRANGKAPADALVELVAFLLSQAGSFMNGSTVVVDCGQMIN